MSESCCVALNKWMARGRAGKRRIRAKGVGELQRMRLTWLHVEPVEAQQATDEITEKAGRSFKCMSSDVDETKSSPRHSLRLDLRTQPQTDFDLSRGVSWIALISSHLSEAAAPHFSHLLSSADRRI